MSLWRELNTPTQVVIIVATAALVGGAGYMGYRALQPVEDAPSASAEPAATEAVAEAPAAEPAPDPAEGLPKIDTWRVDQNGEAVVAGLALPGATVEVMIDGKPAASGVADAKGEFALLFTLPANTAPSLMWLSMTAADAAPVTSKDRIALGPIKGPEPEVAAAAEPTAEETATEGTATAEATGETTAEGEAPVALLVSDEGAVVLQGNEPDPVVAANVTIETIAYTPEGEVQVGGRGQQGAMLRLYLDNGEVGTTEVPANGTWLLTLADAAPGIYTLRVDQLDKDGKVTSRFETPFKRESREALAALARKVTEAEAEAKAAPVEAAPSAADLVPEAAPEPEPAPAVEEPVVAESTTVPGAEPEDAAQPAPAVTETQPEVEVAASEAPEPSVQPAVEPAATETEVASAEPAPEPAPEAAAEPAPEPAPEPEAEVEVAAAEPAPEPAAPVTVTVQPGYTLWGIAQDNYGEGVLYVQLFKANKDQIKDPDLIYPGQVFTVPEETSP